MRVCVVAEFYPRAHDPVLGIWAHRQALAARDAGADVRVLVLHRPVPPRATARRDLLREARRLAAQPRRATLDGLEVEYVPFLAPPRPRHYGSWGAWAAPTLAVALRRLRARFPFDLVHAHNAVPAADAVLRARTAAPLVVSEHGADVFHTAPRHAAGRTATERAFARARLVLANSRGIERACRALGATRTRVLRLGTDLPPARLAATRPPGPPTLVTVAHLVGRKRHADVLRALWLLRDRHPDLRYLVVGDGPEREPLQRLASDLGVAPRVEFAGQLPHDDALARAREGTLFVMPSVDEAFGVAYVEAMAAGVPAIAAAGEPGPEEIARAGDGIRFVAPADIESLAGELDALLGDEVERAQLARRARATVERAFTWERCGQETVRAYRDALAG
ncbi:MAG TPA: glycosyltransferase [Solirubrobacteraceae bacterium]|nr:glycosyltransferase [Solirubrobacteraceae bacterium]